MTVMGAIVPANSAGGDTIRSQMHNLVDQICDERMLSPVAPIGAIDLRGLARTIYDRRRMRSRILPRALLGEPAWDMLLDLAAARGEGKQVSVTSLCIASGVPPTTALRWIGLLTEADLLCRSQDGGDRRRVFIGLTDKAVTALAGYFAAAEMPLSGI